MQHFDEDIRIRRFKFILTLMPLVILIYSSLIYVSAERVEKVVPKKIVNRIHQRINILPIKASHGSNAIDSEVDPEFSHGEPYTDCSLVNVFHPDGHKTAYLTFDDGPSPNITPGILDILDKYRIKATFFVIGSMVEKYPNILRREYEKGNSIGNHTYSHNYKYIYSGIDNFMSDINKEDKELKSVLGPNFSTRLVRFPGGSFGTFMILIKQL